MDFQRSVRLRWQWKLLHEWRATGVGLPHSTKSPAVALRLDKAGLPFSSAAPSRPLTASIQVLFPAPVNETSSIWSSSRSPRHNVLTSACAAIVGMLR